jgi:MFS transporter, DHA1 family, tetracycline resistance protein
MIGPLVFTNIFAAFIGPLRKWHLTGAPFLIAALMLAGATIIAAQATAPGADEEAPDLIASADER